MHHTLLFFWDGVGLGDDDPLVNPFATAELPHFTSLLGEKWYVRGRGTITTPHATLVPTDANLGLDGRPQSATGQATILTGRNVPAFVGEHFGPKPNDKVREALAQGTLFSEAVAKGGTAALLTPYPERYFAAIARGKSLYSAVPQAAVYAGLPLRTADDLRHGRALSPDFTGQGWRDHLGYADVPLLTTAEAGAQLAALAQSHTFSFFEHWPTDQLGHRGTIAEARAHLERVDEVLGGLLANWDEANGLLILTSDHGNLEEIGHRQHTRHPVPTILIGQNHAQLASHITDLTHIAAVVRQW